jgi:hypothetical protein
MWARFAFAALVITALQGSARAASDWYWCDPLQAYYPWVRSCPAPWRPVNAKSVLRQSPASPLPQTATPAPAQESAAEQGEQPGFTPQSFPVRGDALDEWCKGATTALNIALCGDDQLRALAIQRLSAFAEASSRLTADQQKVLIADQNGWAMSYAQACGLSSNVRPSFPLAPSVRDCLAKAGQTRLAYLRAYGVAAAGSNSPSPETGSSAATPAAAPVQSPPSSQSTAAAERSPAPQSPAAAQQPSASQAPGAAAQSSASTASVAEPREVSAPPAQPSTTPHGSAPGKPQSASSPFVSRNISWGTFHGGAVTAVMLIALVTIGLWIWGVLRLVRSRAEERFRTKAGGSPPSSASAPP